MTIRVFLSRSPGLLKRGPASLGHVPHSSIFSTNWLRLWTSTAQSGAWGPAGSLNRISLQLTWSPTDWTSWAPSYIIFRLPPSSCGRHKSHSFNQSTVKVISWYSSTGCIGYLHRCISYFDSLAGVNILQLLYNTNDAYFAYSDVFSKIHSEMVPIIAM